MRVVRAANGDGETPAHVAARSRWACLLRFLLDRGADVLAEDARGRDVLQAACERDRPAVVALILAYVQEHGEDHGEIFDEHVSRFKNKNGVRVWSEGVTLPPSGGARCGALCRTSSPRRVLASRSTRIALTSRTRWSSRGSLGSGFSTCAAAATRTRPVSRGTASRGTWSHETRRTIRL